MNRPDPPIRLPVEEALTTASRRTHAAAAPILLRLLPFLRRQWWRDRFIDNPLLKREIRFHLRRPLTSPGFWLILILAVRLLNDGLWAIQTLMRTIDQLHGGQPAAMGVEFPLSRIPDPVVVWHVAQRGIQVLGWLSPLFLGWAIGRSWAQESEPAVRDSLAVTPFSIRQLMGARVLLWVLVLFGFRLVGELVWSSTVFTRQIIVVHHHSAGSYDIVAHLLRRALWMTVGVAHVLAVVGVATRCSLRRWPPAVVGVVTFLCAEALINAPGVMLLLPPVQVFIRGAWGWVFNVWNTVPALIVAVLTWRGLAARIARDYPLAP